MQKKTNRYLYAGGVLSLAAALLHVMIILGGPDWYRFFGAGEGLAKLAENGASYPTIITTMIGATLALWGLFALSGAGVIRPLPLLRPVLVVVSAIYILRGALGVPLVIYIDHPYLNELAGKMGFMVISSAISLSLGLLYLQGLVQVWAKMGK